MVLNSGGHQHLVSCLETLQKALKGWCVLCVLSTGCCRVENPMETLHKNPTQSVAGAFHGAPGFSGKRGLVFQGVKCFGSG